MSVAISLALLAARDTCSYIQAQAGDGCYSLAQRCGISQDTFMTYNPSPFSCNTIDVGDYVCCSSGTLPDFSPQEQANGSCASYTVQSGDTCSSIATANQIKDWHKIEDVNNQTWAWAGCSLIQIGQKICLSDGTPPFPAPVENTVCGPQVPGTNQPDGMSPEDWAKLNPCPLNACCDVWGQCGISDDFCTPTPADTGAPGTAQPNTNGCISNCGTNITNNGGRTEGLKRIGYFEAWNENRPCLHMDISILENSPQYTHVHFGFGNLSTDWQPDVSGAQDQFNDFKALQGIGRILSFGGWAFSTDPNTYNIFRTGVQPGNRQAFADNVVKFIEDNDLDGVDFDWEYPGAQDIPGIPPDSVDSGSNYYEFLKLVRGQLDSTKTLSIAAPASYWYLKGFPIANISTTVDYIVYMTYDLHGQWDYGNTFVDPGCPSGNCLRSQVNETETKDALAMITKAGVPASQVVVGMALYGRSFEMTEAGCTGPMCAYTGPDSGATPGRCTQTAGYISNAEIFEIIDDAQKNGQSIQQYYDQGDVLIYNETQWVSYLSPSSYTFRQALTDALNFAGTSDWAIDLNGTYASDAGFGESGESDDNDDDVDFDACDYTLSFATLDDLNAASGGMRSDCIDAYALDTLEQMLETAYANYTDVNNGYDEMFGYYVTYMKKLVPEVAANEFIFNLSTTGEYATFPDLGFGIQYFDCATGKNGANKFPCTELSKTANQHDAAYYTTSFTLTDPDGYQGALAEAGLDPDWVVFGDYELDRAVSAPHGGRTFKYKFTGFPVENSSMVVPNPKDIVTQGLGSIPDIQLDMQATLLDMYMLNWMNGSTEDPAQAYSAPVFMLMQAVDGMAQAKQLGQQEQQEEEEEEKRKKDFILLIVSVVLMFVPVVGEELAVAAGFATLARAIAIAGELGNAALGIYDTVEDPKSAIVNILGMLLGVGAIAKVARDGKGIGDIAKIRRGMSEDSVASLGTIFKNNDDKLQSVMKVCKFTG